MKLKNKLTSTLFALSLMGLSSVVLAGVSPQFTVDKYNLKGYTDPTYIKPETRNQLVLLLKSYTGNDVTVAKLNELKEKIQALLNKEAKGVFTVTIPPQKVMDKSVEFNVNFVAGKVVYNETKGFSKENVKNSLPSLSEGVQFYAGRPWVDERELTLAAENPLKLTQVQYELAPGKPITANVNTLAPRGKHLRYVSLDNYGKESLDYLRVNAGYINANFSGYDDVLSMFASTNTKRPQETLLFGLNYDLPLYKLHSRFSVLYAHSSTDIKSFKVNEGLKLDATGGADVIAPKFSYYLPHYNFGYSNQLKLNLGYNFQRLKQKTEDVRTRALIGRSGIYYVSPISAGISGKIIPTQGIDLDFDLSYNALYAGILGSDQIFFLREYGQRLKTAEKYQDFWKGSLTAKFDLPYGFKFNTTNAFQYSNKHLISHLRTSTGVRGFRVGGGSGDSGAYTANELIAPNLSSRPELSLRPYAFLDVGMVHYNRNDLDKVENPTLQYNSEKYTDEELEAMKLKNETPDVNTMWVATTGLGLKASFKDFSTDVYLAHKLKGKDGKHDRNTLWFNATYRF